MMMILQIVLFTVLCAVAAYFSFKGYNRVYKNIMLGKKADYSDNAAQRFRNMMLIALGQKKMFKNIQPAILHIFIYVGFVITQIELIEVFIDGFTAHHRILFHAVENIAALKAIYVFV